MEMEWEEVWFGVCWCRNTRACQIRDVGRKRLPEGNVGVEVIGLLSQLGVSLQMCIERI